MSSQPKVIAVVLNWNRAADTAECIRSLREVEYSNLEILAVDNGSTDGSAAFLKGQFPGLALLEHRENLGYCEGNNAGIRYALERGAQYVLLFNNDAVADKHLLSELVSVAQSDSSMGVLGAKIYNYWRPQEIWFAGATIDSLTGESPHVGRGETDRGQFEDVVQVDRLCGCAMMVRREVFEKAGLLDPDYFLYYEDVDFCLRAARAGYKNICVQTAKVWHKESASAKTGAGFDYFTYYLARNRLLFLKKHFRIGPERKRKNRLFRATYPLRLTAGFFDPARRRSITAKYHAIKDFEEARFGAKSSLS